MSIATALRERAFELGPGVLTASRSKPDGEARVSVTLPAFADLAKIAERASAAARLDLMAALQIEAQSKAGRPAQMDPAVQARIADLMASRRAELPAPRGQPEAAMDLGAHPDDEDAAQSIVAAGMEDDEMDPAEDAADDGCGSRSRPADAAQPWVDEKEERRRAAEQIRQGAIDERTTREAAHLTSLRGVLAHGRRSCEPHWQLPATPRRTPSIRTKCPYRAPRPRHSPTRSRTRPRRRTKGTLSGCGEDGLALVDSTLDRVASDALVVRDARYRVG
jgi:hypothetical protein